MFWEKDCRGKRNVNSSNVFKPKILELINEFCRIDQDDEDLESPSRQTELQAAAELLTDLQMQLECVSNSVL